MRLFWLGTVRWDRVWQVVVRCDCLGVLRSAPVRSGVVGLLRCVLEGCGNVSCVLLRLDRYGNPRFVLVRRGVEGPLRSDEFSSDSTRRSET